VEFIKVTNPVNSTTTGFLKSQYRLKGLFYFPNIKIKGE